MKGLCRGWFLLLLLTLPCLAQESPKWELFAGPSYLGQSRGNGTIQNNIGIHASLTRNLSKHWSLVGDYSLHWGHPQRNELEFVTVIRGTEPTPGTPARPDTKVGRGRGTCNPQAANPAIPGCGGTPDIPGTPPETIITRQVAFMGINKIHRYMAGLRYRRQAPCRSDWCKFTVFAHGLLGPSITTLRGSSQSGMALALGGGIDYEIADRFSARVLQVDYVPIYLNGRWLGGVRASGGLVVKLGGSNE